MNLTSFIMQVWIYYALHIKTLVLFVNIFFGIACFQRSVQVTKPSVQK